jgi:CheY-like chemotaxis protein
METIDIETAESKAIADRVRDLLDRRNIGKRQHASEIQRILGLSYSQAHRKMRGLNPWTISQIKAVADAFGESPGSLVENISIPESVSARAPGQDALFIIDGRPYPCLAVIGREITDTAEADFVATNDLGQWRVFTGHRAPDGKKHFVESIELHNQQSSMNKALIAVVDDDENVTSQLCKFLNANGFVGAPFNDERNFRQALETVAFDGFILDWLIGQETAEESIRHIRQSDNAAAPILLLTGKIDTGEVDEGDLAKVIQRFDVVTFEKPARPSILTAEITKRIAAIH